MKEFLTGIDLFRGLPPETLALLEPEARRRTFSSGSKLFVQGGAHAAMYVIIQGRVRTERRHPDIRGAVVLAEYGPGEAVGGDGVLDGAPSSHTAIAIERTVTVELTAVCLTRLLAQPSEASSRLMNSLYRRWRQDGTVGAVRPASDQDR